MKSLDSNRRSKSLERTKRQLEEENVSALYETSKLRQELRKEKRALAKERSERARQSLEIDLLRKDNISALKNLCESQIALREAQDQCRELEASLRSQNETTYTAQDVYTEESPITVHGSSSDDVSDDFMMPYPIEEGSNPMSISKTLSHRRQAKNVGLRSELPQHLQRPQWLALRTTRFRSLVISPS